MLSSKEIRQGYIDFFTNKGHVFVPSGSVVPKDDPTLMFTNAGMNQFKDIFIGTRKIDDKRAVNSQKCIRVSGKHNDLEEVGRDTYHHTFFEMLGNWSFGDYFKSEAISWAWELFTEVWELDKNILWATVFGGDEKEGLEPDVEAEELWKANTDIDPSRILRCGKKDNFWEMGDVGPCGPCSEIHIDLGPDFCDMAGVQGHQCRVNGDCGRFIELWNLVFIQMNRDNDGKLTNLPDKHVDTGAGLERVTAVLQKKRSNYDTDLFMPIIDEISNLTGKKYTYQLGNDVDNAFRVIADHIRTLTFSITDGALPSNDGRGYILRRILRRAVRFGLLLDMHEPFLYKLVPTVVEVMGESYPEIKQRAGHVMNVVEAEESSFDKTLDRGMALFQADVADLQQADKTELPGDKAFRLHDTYGFPLDLTQLLAEEKGMTVDVGRYDELMAQQRKKAQDAQKNISYQADELGEKLPVCEDKKKYKKTKMEAKLLGYVDRSDYATEGAIPTDKQIGLVLDRTCAYAENGGQVGDSGVFIADNGVFAFEDAQKIGRAVVHFGKIDSGNLSIGSIVEILIDPAREDVKRNHTATHILQWALREVLGDHVHQEGSYVCRDHLRFDFTHPKAPGKEQLVEVEDLVRQKIDDPQRVSFETMDMEKAKKLGAMALFSEKYGESVQVVGVGANKDEDLDEAFSLELCGGTHVKNTGEIGSFMITREESVATGVRRVTAMTGKALNELLYERYEELEGISVLLKARPEETLERVAKLIDDNKKLSKQLKKGAAGDLKNISAKLLDNAKTIGDAKLIIGELPSATVDMLRQQIDWLRKKAPSSVIVLGSPTEDGKVLLFAAVTDNLVKKGVKAGDIVKQIAPIVGGGGGGRPQMAQAGGKNPAKLTEALKAAQELTLGKL